MGSAAPLEPPVCLGQPAAVRGLHSAPVVLSLAQVRRLLQAVLPLPVLDVEAALDLLLYQQERKAAAYCSHRKRILRHLALLNPP